MAELTEQEVRRYQAQILLPGMGRKGQKKLKAGRALIIGAGGLGTPVMQYLTAAGIGHLGIVDDDMVDIPDLQRQVLYGINDVGKLKTVVARERLRRQNQAVSFEIYNLRLSEGNILSIIEGYDLVIDGSNNFETRYLIDDACLARDKTWIFGAIHQFEGQVTVLNYKEGPTLRCMFPDPPLTGEIQPSRYQAGILGALPGIIGCYQAMEAIKIMTGLQGVLSGKLLTINVLENTQKLKSFSRKSGKPEGRMFSD